MIIISEKSYGKKCKRLLNFRNGQRLRCISADEYNALSSTASHLHCFNERPLNIFSRHKSSLVSVFRFQRVKNSIRAYIGVYVPVRFFFLLILIYSYRRMGNKGNKYRKTALLLTFCVLEILFHEPFSETLGNGHDAYRRFSWSTGTYAFCSPYHEIHILTEVP